MLRLILLVAVVVVTSGGMIYTRLIYAPLRDPADATPEELLIWAATVDLSQTPERTRSTLAVRLEREYRGRFDPAAIRESTAPKYYDRVMANLPILFRTWVFDRAEAYQEADPGERKRLIDDTLSAVDAWGSAEIWNRGASNGSESSTTAFLQRIQNWREEASIEQRARLDTFLRDLQATRLMRAILGVGERGNAEKE